MEIKNSIEIIDITHNDLVDLFSVALCGNTYMSAEYDSDFYKSIPDDKKEGECFEDHLADVLLNGGHIFIYDAYSEGELYSENAELITEEYGCETYAQYKITLKDVIRGLERAASGTYKTNNDDKFIRQCFDDLITDDSYNLDLIEGDALMQIITFNEYIYG